jgi:hypothetical protein
MKDEKSIKLLPQATKFIYVLYFSHQLVPPGFKPLNLLIGLLLHPSSFTLHPSY